MGLDSVELVVAVERRFNFDIPDREAEQLATVEAVVAYVCRRQQIPADSAPPAIFGQLLERVMGCVQQVTGAASLVASTRLDALWLPENLDAGMLQLRNCLGMPLPDLLTPRKGIGLWLYGPRQLRKSDYEAKTLADVVDWLLALHHPQLLFEAATRYEVERIVVGITSFISGVGVEEIKLTDSFTRDLGID
ncbi:phosphopantetheine-binding protein [Hymenobacter persicinus]|uniref:Carrier domain-containing protein n=1 Tax=Hymenobacter persicinus TaxID=2025506 RepID=A0A4V1ZB91_9BACT|nr:phosphopantetheine-binding protein [Hymenobacter persicinus]RYU84263.1 hypothetical protein EWM57_00800 [Hymenobacter persicinus]